MEYKAPKLKLKKRKMDYGMTGKPSEDAMLEEGEGKPKRTPLKLMKLMVEKGKMTEEDKLKFKLKLKRKK